MPSKSGCATCRIRRIKCDEERPDCRKCKSTGRTCNGYSPLPFSRRDYQAAAVSASQGPLHSAFFTDPAFNSVLERRYFDLFHRRVISGANTLSLSGGFWERVVLQSYRSEPAAKYALLALSALHEYKEVRNDHDLLHQHRAFLEQQHHKALMAARMLVASADSNVGQVLVVCILLTSYEGIKGHYESRLAHIEHGKQLLRTYWPQLQHYPGTGAMKKIQSTLWRHDFQSHTFQDRTAPKPTMISPVERLMLEKGTNSSAFDTIYDAQASLVYLLRYFMSSDVPASAHSYEASDLSRSPDQIHDEQTRCALLLSNWQRGFEKLLSQSNLAENAHTLLLRMWHTNATAILKAGAFGPVRRWDDVQSEFGHIVDIADRLVTILERQEGRCSFSLELGYVDLCFFVASRCRHPFVRRRAVEVLRRLQRQEGLWQSTAAAAVAERYIEIEEEGLQSIASAADVPESSRIQNIETAANADESMASMRFFMFDLDTNDNATYSREEIVRWVT